MIELSHSWVWLLLPLPWVARRYLSRTQIHTFVFVPFPTTTIQKTTNRPLSSSILVGIWLCLLTALSKPIWLGAPTAIKAEHRDIVLAIDLSASMSVEDMPHPDGTMENRLSAMSRVLNNFVQQRKGDRMGLVLFADTAHLHTPLTLDRTFIEQQIDQLTLGLAGYMTAIGDGVATAVKLLIDSNSKQRVVILVSDGSNTSGQLLPIQAAQLALKHKTTIYSIGLGATQLTQTNQYGESFVINPALDLDEALLQEMATLTGGRYFRASTPEQLRAIYQIIHALEPLSESQLTLRPEKNLYRWPLTIAAVLFVLLISYRKFYG